MWYKLEWKLVLGSHYQWKEKTAIHQLEDQIPLTHSSTKAESCLSRLELSKAYRVLPQIHGKWSLGSSVVHFVYWKIKSPGRRIRGIPLPSIDDDDNSVFFINNSRILLLAFVDLFQKWFQHQLQTKPRSSASCIYIILPFYINIPLYQDFKEIYSIQDWIKGLIQVWQSLTEIWMRNQQTITYLKSWVILFLNVSNELGVALLFKVLKHSLKDTHKYITDVSKHCIFEPGNIAHAWPFSVSSWNRSTDIS